MALFLFASGTLILMSLPFALESGETLLPPVTLGAVNVLLAAVSGGLPWDRWHPGWLLGFSLLAFTLIGLFRFVGPPAPYTDSLVYILYFAWLGLWQPPAVSLLVSPFAVATYVFPLYLAGRGAGAMASVMVVIPVGLLIGMVIARRVLALKESQASLLQQHQQLVGMGTFRQGLTNLIQRTLERGLDEGFYQQLLDQTIELIPGAQAGSIVVLRGDMFHFVAAVKFDLNALKATPLTMEAVDRVNDSAQPKIVRNIRDYNPKVVAVHGAPAKITASLSIPVQVEGARAAVMYLDNFTDAEAFDEDAVKKATLLATPIGVLFQRFTLEQQLRAYQQELEGRNAELDYRAHVDALTGLPNRTVFFGQLARLLRQGTGGGQRVALLFIDLDGFKRVNDTRGHDVGDQLLQAVADRLKGCVRKGDTVCRLAGDEFTIVLPHQSRASDAEVVARNVLASLRQPFQLADCEVVISSSIGIAMAPQHATTVESLVKCADTAMYCAKEAGKNRFVLFEPGG